MATVHEDDHGHLAHVPQRRTDGHLGTPHPSNVGVSRHFGQWLMRSMKTSGGLTRGRCMTETQRLAWLMAHPVCAEVNNAAQRLDHGKARERYDRLV